MLTARTLIIALAISLALVGCSAEPEGISVGAPGDTVTASPLPSAYLDAIEATSNARTYAFESELRVRTEAGVVQVRLRGEKTLEGRTVTVTTNQGAATYVVNAGTATVDRGNGPTTVTLSEVPDAPSLRALAGLRDAVVNDDGSVSGVLDGSAIVTGEDVPDEVEVTVRIAGGIVTSVELTSTDGAWSTVTAFRNVTA